MDSRIRWYIAQFNSHSADFSKPFLKRFVFQIINQMCMKKQYRIILSALLLNSGLAWAQTDTLQTKDLLDMSLEDLMNIQVVSASKKVESLFDSPLSASVLTKEEIQKAGCTSIMEAFKLMPGLIVREQSNGNFDIHLRGMNNLLKTGSMAHSSNLCAMTLPMRKIIS